MSIIETRGLRRTFGSRKGEVVAVAGVDLSVEPGEIFGFLGPNGAGKTTTLRMLATLLTPTGGSATMGRPPCRVCKRTSCRWSCSSPSAPPGCC